MGTVEGQQKFNLGAGGDISTKIDLVAEKSVFDTLKRNNFIPDVVGEECGFVKGNDSGLIVMDGIDGTTNANCGLPFYCCSLAYSPNKNLQSITDAVVFNLLSGDLYYASKNKGSFFNGKKLDLSKKTNKSAKDMVIGLNISGLSENLFVSISKLVSSVNHIRHLGANALEVCYFAQGSIDAYIDLRNKIRAIDMAACYLIAKEAGGFIYDVDGNDLNCDLSIDSRMSFIAVSNAEIYNWIYTLTR
ncbi:MAG: fructose 1,6-bisphosphatase [Nitrosopumilus sp.]|nr:fructose 1,6-bisphosphatase [Nitrosopumilus sp.]